MSDAKLNCACGGFVPSGAPCCNGCGRTREQIVRGWNRLADTDELRVVRMPRRETAARLYVTLGCCCLLLAAGGEVLFPEVEIAAAAIPGALAVACFVAAVALRMAGRRAP